MWWYEWAVVIVAFGAAIVVWVATIIVKAMSRADFEY